MKGNLLRNLALASALFASAALAGCSGEAAAGGGSEARAETYFIFDTVVTVKVFDERADDATFEHIRELLERIDATMSRQVETSEISGVNRMAGVEPVRVSEETFRLVEKGIRYWKDSGGKFDPAIGPLVDVWDIGSDAPRKPSVEEIQSASALVDADNVVLDDTATSIYLTEPGMSLDLGAIAKGYAGDVVADYLRAEGLNSAIVDLGGNIVAVGEKAAGKPWTIGVQDPEDARGASIGSLKAVDQTIVSSGVYERFFIEDGVRYHHILDPATGYPVDNELLSVTILTERSADADALSTAAFALGLADGMAFVESTEKTEAVFITASREVYLSSGLRDSFRLTSDKYALK
ncbi:FAD:protein FMN transferase [Paenibacillus antri]|uniref:FAD:protein FMN transferase n=1 Tax=Paenibacillus antri TaxID=2582848 RepID=A0A5R9G378_9BACL|nr:FAD:protein FMN transferase [Paenibacillus antri]TLS48570.1 FAD:protein FMN transferase [Paenibacillus antri]